MKRLLIIKNNYITTKINMNELEWYIDYLDFQMMMKHKDNPMLEIDNDYMILQSIKVILKHLSSLEISSGNNRGYGVHNDSELIGLLFQKNKHTPHIATSIAEIENTSAI